MTSAQAANSKDLVVNLHSSSSERVLCLLVHGSSIEWLSSLIRVENDAKNGYHENPGKEILEKWSKNAFFPSGTVPKR